MIKYTEKLLNLKKEYITDNGIIPNVLYLPIRMLDNISKENNGIAVAIGCGRVFGMDVEYVGEGQPMKVDRVEEAEGEPTITIQSAIEIEKIGEYTKIKIPSYQEFKNAKISIKDDCIKLDNGVEIKY